MMPAKGVEKPKGFWKKLMAPKLSSPPPSEEEEEEEELPDRLEEEDLDWRGNPRDGSERGERETLAVAKIKADAGVTSRAEKKKKPEPSTKAPEEEGVDWMGNPRDAAGGEGGGKKEARVSSSSMEVETGRRWQRRRSIVVTEEDDGEKLAAGVESLPRDVIVPPETAEGMIIVPGASVAATAAAAATAKSGSSSSAASPPPSGKNKKAAPKASPEAETAVVVAAEGRRRLTKSEAVRVPATGGAAGEEGRLSVRGLGAGQVLAGLLGEGRGGATPFQPAARGDDPVGVRAFTVPGQTLMFGLLVLFSLLFCLSGAVVVHVPLLLLLLLYHGKKRGRKGKRAWGKGIAVLSQWNFCGTRSTAVPCGGSRCGAAVLGGRLGL
ncbi:unnamed protein product [Ectocarpus fasciculatus]